MSASDYQASTPGSVLLPYPILKYLLTSEPVLGSASDTIPDGPFNRELCKLLLNTGALANTFYYYMARTVQVMNESAPAVTDPLASFTTLTGAPTSNLVNGLFHAMLYNDKEVVYRYSTTTAKWHEMFRYDWSPTVTGISIQNKTVSTAITASANEISVSIPTTDSEGNACAFDLTNLRTYYVKRLDANEVMLGCLAGLDNNTSGVVKFYLPTPADHNSDYTLVTYWEKITILA